MAQTDQTYELFGFRVRQGSIQEEIVGRLIAEGQSKAFIARRLKAFPDRPKADRPTGRTDVRQADRPDELDWTPKLLRNN